MSNLAPKKSDLKSILQNVGFSEKEADVYLALLELNEAFPGTIASKLNISRSTVYGALETLQKKDLVIQVKRGGKLHYHALNPKEFLEEKRNQYGQLQASVDALEQALPLLRNQYSEYAISPAFPTLGLEETLDMITERIMESITQNAAIFLLDEDRKVAKVYRFTDSPSGKFVLKAIKNQFEILETPYDKPLNKVGECIAKNKIVYGETIKEFAYPSFSEALCKKIQNFSKIKKIIGYPVSIDSKVIGVTLFAFNELDVNMFNEIIEKIKPLLNQIAIALQNALQYETLKEKYQQLLKENKKQHDLLYELRSSFNASEKTIRASAKELRRLVSEVEGKLNKRLPDIHAHIIRIDQEMKEMNRICGVNSNVGNSDKKRLT